MTPRFYWYPSTTGALRVTELDALAELDATPRPELADGRSVHGLVGRDLQGMSWTVRVTADRFGDPSDTSVEREIRALVGHLIRGGVVGLATGAETTWASRGTAPTAGDVSIRTSGNALAPWSDTATLTTGDELAVELGWPTPAWEHPLVTAPLGGTRVYCDALLQDYADDVVVRHRDCYPYLRLPAEAVREDLLTTDYRLSWTLRLDLEWSPSAWLASWGRSVERAGAAGLPGYRGVDGTGAATLSGAIERYPGRFDPDSRRGR